MSKSNDEDFIAAFVETFVSEHAPSGAAVSPDLGLGDGVLSEDEVAAFYRDGAHCNTQLRACFSRVVGWFKATLSVV